MMSGNRAAAAKHGMPWPAIALVLLIAAGAYWAWRGPARGLASDTGSADLRLLAASARGFVQGANPYDLQAVAPFWPASAGEQSASEDWRDSDDLLYPPSALVLVAPVAMLPWTGIKVAWLGLNAIAMVVILASLFRILDQRATPPVRTTLVLMTLIFAPVISTFALGQTSLLTLAFVASAHWARMAKVWWLSGMLFGLAAALKPQIGVVFLAYEIFRFRWKAGSVAIVVAGVCLGAGAARLGGAGIDWLPALRDNVNAFMTVGAGDPSMANPMRYQLINLHALLHGLTDDRRLVSALVWLVVGGLGLGYFIYWLRRREGAGELLTLSMACPLTLLLAYHRSYDAAIMLLPIAWALGEIGRYRRAEGRSIFPPVMALACCSVWLVPTDAILFALERRGFPSEAITHTTIYQLTVIPHRIWAMLALALTLIVAMARRRPKAPVALFRRECDDDPELGAAGARSLARPTGRAPRPT